MRRFALTLAILSMAVDLSAQVSKQLFGKTPDGTSVDIYTLKNGSIEARIITYGGSVQSLKVPDRNGKVADVVLGYDSIEGYAGGPKPSSHFFGALIGRYGNRIAGGKFTLNGKTYEISKGQAPNALHGGVKGFDKVVWKGTEIPHGVELTYVSPDGDQGFPGTLTIVVRYTLEGKDLKIDYSATTDKDTVINLTNHSYFNLAGEGNGDILKHELKITASRYTPVNESLIPTGLASVEGTPFDFRKATVIGSRINDDNDQLKKGNGYDHNWVLESGGANFSEAAELYDPSSGRILQVLTDQPGLQFYSGNFHDDIPTGKGGKVYGYRSGLCLETQHFPDSPNHTSFPSTELKPGEKYHTVTVFRFSAR